MATILHITTETGWDAAKADGEYSPPSLGKAGFIHCSDPDQVLLVADGIFRGRQGLVLLVIDTDRVDAEIRWENCEGGSRLFPHVYGPLDPGAVTGVVPFPPEDDGTFRLPEEIGSGG